jgi:hypothetical protein
MMRTLLKVIVLLFFSSHLGFSALLEDSYGFLGGLSSFRQEISNDTTGTKRDFLTGSYVGAFGERYLSPSWIFSPGVFISQKGVQNSGSFTRATYLEASAQLRWYFADKPRWRSYLGFGGGFGILLDAQTVSSTGQNSAAWGYLNKNELSAQLGAGFEFPVSSDVGLQFGCSYVYGLSSNLDPSTSGGLNGRWTGIYGFVGLRFKTTQESDGPQERAMDYLRWKNGGMKSSFQKEPVRSQVEREKAESARFNEEPATFSLQSEKVEEPEKRMPQAKIEQTAPEAQKPEPQQPEPLPPMEGEW